MRGMELHQINLSYVPVQDRLLMRISTRDQTEFRLWFTRRLTQRLWPSLFKLLETHETVSTQATADAKRAVLEFRHEHAMQQVSFGSEFAGTDLKPALEGEPMLVQTVEMKRSGEQHYLMKFLPPQGSGIQVQFQEAIVHGLAKLIADALKRSDWGLQLQLPGTQPGLAAGAEPAPAAQAAPRTLN